MVEQPSGPAVVPILAGPTASGKTRIAMQLATQFPIEIISADSRQVFCHLDIGTGKPTAEECARVPTHLINCIQPGERFNVARFVHAAGEKILEVQSRGKIPLVVGGTGMYLKALTDGIIELDETDLKLRATLEQELTQHGAEVLWNELQQLDPLEAAKIHPNNHYRLLRALEIIRATGKTKSQLMAWGTIRPQNTSFTQFTLVPDRAELYQAINTRVVQMIESGWLDEVRSLIQSGLSDAVRRSAVIGYTELLDVVENGRDLAEAVGNIKQQTRNYAKRQLTWFRHQSSTSTPFSPPNALPALVDFFRQRYFS